MANTFCDETEITSLALFWEGLPKKNGADEQRRVRFLRACRSGQVQAGSLEEVAFGLALPSSDLSPVMIGSSEMSWASARIYPLSP